MIQHSRFERNRDALLQEFDEQCIKNFYNSVGFRAELNVIHTGACGSTESQPLRVNAWTLAPHLFRLCATCEILEGMKQ